MVRTMGQVGSLTGAETHWSTVTESLPYLMKRLEAKKYKMVTVAECLGIKPCAS